MNCKPYEKNCRVSGTATLVVQAAGDEIDIPPKNTITVIGEADPVKVIKKVRKFRKYAAILSVGPAKEEKKDGKKESKDVISHLPKTCCKCDV
ncbi:hypothetical protein SDJN02_13000, partial [Cucurbita argyrosperma subsp. argyrosperma]